MHHSSPYLCVLCLSVCFLSPFLSFSRTSKKDSIKEYCVKVVQKIKANNWTWRKSNLFEAKAIDQTMASKKYYPNALHVSPTSLSEAQRLANRTTGLYLTRTFNVDPPERRMMPGRPVYKTTTERLRMGIDCDEVYPGIIIGKTTIFRPKYVWKRKSYKMYLKEQAPY